MYTVIEFWTPIPEASQQTIAYAKDTITEAMSSYHYILHQATVSAHYKHGAVVFDDEGRVIARECYKHEVEHESES